MARRIKIVSDGTVPGTKVFAVDPTGVNEPEPVKGVTGVAWTIDTQGGKDHGAIASVELTFGRAEVELEGDEQERPSGD
jgi:hypothetical protein